MDNTVKKTNKQILQEGQDIVDKINKEKEEIEKSLQVIDVLEQKKFNQSEIDEIIKEKEEVKNKINIINSLQNQYYDLVEEAKNNNKR